MFSIISSLFIIGRLSNDDARDDKFLNYLNPLSMPLGLKICSN